MGNLGILEVEGTDAAAFLQGYITADLDNINESKAMLMALTDIKGRVLSNGWAYGTTECVSLVMHDSLLTEIERHLRRYMVFSKSNCRKLDLSLDCTTQPTAVGTILQPMQWQLKIHDSENSNWPTLTVNAELPLVTSKTSGLFLPQMLGLTDHGAVDFTKGCYLGQEVVARAQHRGAVKRRAQRFEIKDGNPQLGEKLKAETGANGIVVARNGNRALVVVSGTPQNLVSQNGADLIPA